MPAAGTANRADDLAARMAARERLGRIPGERTPVEGTSPPMGEVPDPILDAVVADAMERTGVAAADIEIAAAEILHIRERLNGIIARHTGQPLERIADDVDRDRFMSPEQAVDYGLIDRVLEGPVQTTEGKPADSDSAE